MKTINLSFPVSISPSGDMTVEYPVSLSELKKLKKAIDDEEDDFCDVERLSDLYDKVVSAAYDEMANGLFDNKEIVRDVMNGTYSFDKSLDYVKSRFDIVVDYPEIEE